MTLVSSPEHAAQGRRSYAANRPVRRALRSGEVSIAAVMGEQPAGLRDRTLFEVLLMAHHFGRARLRALNDRALDAHVNLAQTLGAADERTRDWVSVNALAHGRAPASIWQQLLEE